MTTHGPGADNPSVDPGLTTAVGQAVDDLAQRLGVQPDEITVVSGEVVTWPDAGLGCHEPGRMYAQVLVDGARIVLAHGGRKFSYHTGGRTSTPFLCEHPTS
jgi:hypothetical protein